MSVTVEFQGHGINLKVTGAKLWPHTVLFYCRTQFSFVYIFYLQATKQNKPLLIIVRFAEVSTSWSGALRFGFTLHDPATLTRESLPRYACPDLTNRPGYWAKALPERLARLGSVLTFRYTVGGDVLFAIDGEEKGVSFTGISAKFPLWALIDIYGNTTCIEFVGK